MVFQLSIPYSIFHFAAQAHPVGGQVVASQAVAMDPMVKRAERELSRAEKVLEKAEEELKAAENEGAFVHLHLIDLAINLMCCWNSHLSKVCQCFIYLHTWSLFHDSDSVRPR